MACAEIAEQRGAAFVPVQERIAIVQRPFVPARAARKDAPQIGVPGRVGRDRLRHVAFARPGFLGPAVAVEMRDDVEEFAAPDGIVHHMAVRPHPHRAVGDINVARHRVRRRHAAPADAAGEARYIGAEQTVAHHRMNAVGADHDVGLDLAAVGKARHGVLGAALDRHGAHPVRISVVLSAPARIASRSARCTARFGAPNFSLKSLRRVREM